MTIDFLIGAVRASRDLHPLVKTELEEILHRNEPVKPIRVRDCVYCGYCEDELFEGNAIKDNYCQKCGKPVDWS